MPGLIKVGWDLNKKLLLLWDISCWVHNRAYQILIGFSMNLTSTLSDKSMLKLVAWVSSQMDFTVKGGEVNPEMPRLSIN